MQEGIWFIEIKQGKGKLKLLNLCTFKLNKKFIFNNEHTLERGGGGKDHFILFLTKLSSIEDLQCLNKNIYLSLKKE